MSLSGALRNTAGSHGGEFSAKRVAKRVYGLSQAVNFKKRLLSMFYKQLGCLRLRNLLSWCSLKLNTMTVWRYQRSKTNCDYLAR